ncbi:MAG: UPF0175 family protein [Fimbriimonadales bacterium]|nr:UPF0175 family protein [Fimbriimonadales bacterium]
MSVIVSEEMLRETQMSEDEFRQELAIWLYREGRLTLAQAARWAGITRLQFQRALSDKGLSIHYETTDLDEDLRGLEEAGLI